MHASSPSQHRGSQGSPIHPQGHVTESETNLKVDEQSSWRLPAAIVTPAGATDVKDREIPFTD